MMEGAGDELGLTMAQAGAMMSAFYAGYVLAQIPSGIVADRMNSRLLLVSALFLSSLCTLANGAMRTFGSGLAWRFLSGLSAGAIYPSSLKVISSSFGREQRATAVGIFMTAVSAGMMISNGLVPGVVARLGWRSGFVVTGWAGLAAAGVLLVIGWPAISAWPASEAKRSTGNYASPSTQRVGPRPLRVMLNRNMVLLCLAGFFGMWGTTGSIPWLFSSLTRGRGISAANAGIMLMVFSAASALGGPAAGCISDRVLRSRKPAIALGLWIFAALLTAMALLPGTGVTLWVVSAALGFFVLFPDTPRNTMISETVGPELGGTAIGIANTLWQGGLIISPLVAGKILDATGGSFRPALLSLSAPGAAPSVERAGRICTAESRVTGPDSTEPRSL